MLAVSADGTVFVNDTEAWLLPRDRGTNIGGKIMRKMGPGKQEKVALCSLLIEPPYTTQLGLNLFYLFKSENIS